MKIDHHFRWSVVCGNETKSICYFGVRKDSQNVQNKLKIPSISSVISFGEGCAREFPGVYAKLDEPETLCWVKNSIIGDVCDDPPIRRRFFDLFNINDQ
jgi:hypothetical protein